MGFEFAYIEAAVHYLSYYATRPHHPREGMFLLIYFLEDLLDYKIE